MSAPADFIVTNHGTLFMLLPVSEPARDWCDENLPSDAMMLGGTYAVEHRYIDAIVDGLDMDGLTWQ